MSLARMRAYDIVYSDMFRRLDPIYTVPGLCYEKGVNLIYV